MTDDKLQYDTACHWRDSLAGYTVAVARLVVFAQDWPNRAQSTLLKRGEGGQRRATQPNARRLYR